MLLIPTRIGPSPIHGIGLFALEFIPQDTITWRYTPGLDLRLEYSFVRALARHKRIEIINYAGIGRSHRYLVLSGDNARFINHSLKANTTFDGNCAWAIRDIEAGEEITENYRDYGKRPAR